MVVRERRGKRAGPVFLSSEEREGFRFSLSPTTLSAPFYYYPDRLAAIPPPDRFRQQARLTRYSEPILVPKVRINFADFPYVH